MKEKIVTEKGPKPAGPYSPGVRVNGFVFLSGQISADPHTGELVNDSIEAATDRALENLSLVLAGAGMTLEHVVKTTVFLRDMNDFSAMNAAYGKRFGDTPPARTTIQVARLPRDARIEIEAIALDPQQSYPFAK